MAYYGDLEREKKKMEKNEKDVCVPSKWVWWWQLSYWLDKNDDTGEMAALMATLQLVCTNPAQRRL